MPRFVSSRIVRNYFENASLRMATYKVRPEIIGVHVKYRGVFENVYVAGEDDGLMNLVTFDKATKDAVVNEHFPRDRVIRTKDDVHRLISDVTHGRYMLCLDLGGDDDGIFAYYIPDSLLDEYSVLIDKQHIVIVSKKVAAAERMPECPEVRSRDELIEILKKYE